MDLLLPELQHPISFSLMILSLYLVDWHDTEHFVSGGMGHLQKCSMHIHFCLTCSLHCLYYSCQRLWCLQSYNTGIIGFWSLCNTELQLFSSRDSVSDFIQYHEDSSQGWKMIWWIILFKNIDHMVILLKVI